jgi:hypothetical protein
MKLALPPRTDVFLILVLLSLANIFFTEDLSIGLIAGIVPILIASLKVRLVFIKFMELETDADPWRWLFEAWLALVTTTIIAGYVLSKSPKF